MATQLQDVITAVRLRHPAYSSDNVPNRVLAEAFTALQRRLIALATEKRPTFCVQRYSVVFAFGSGNQPGTAGANSSGGLPATADSAGAVMLAEQTIGIAPAYDFSAPVVLADTRVITVVSVGATTTTLTVQGSPAWTVNAFAGDLFQITDGPGYGPEAVRAIVSNTAGTVTVTGSYDVTPQANLSVGRIIEVPAQSSTQLGVVTNLPALNKQSGYLIKLSSTGVAYLDLDSPVVTRFAAGIPLPPRLKLLGASVVWSGATTAAGTDQTVGPISPQLSECTLVPYGNRNHYTKFPSCYILGDELVPLGTTQDWSGIEGLDLRYVPIAPSFGATATTLEEYFLLPDSAYDVLVAHGALVAARYAQAKDIPVSVLDALAEAAAAEAVWLKMVGRMGSAEYRTAQRNR